MNSQLKNGAASVASTIFSGSARREGERSEADRSADPEKIVPNLRPDPEVVADAKRRTFTAAYKIRILDQAEAAKVSGSGVGALLRREGLYSSHLAKWRRERQASLQQALQPKPRGPKPQHDPHQTELLQLRRDNVRLTEALRKAEIVIDVQKKLATLLGWPLATDPATESKP